MKRIRSIAIAAFFAAALLGCTARQPPPGGYVLQFGKDFKPGMNSVDELGLSIVLVVDVSGSMADAPANGGSPKFVQAARAFGTITGYLEKFAARQKDLIAKVAILKFSAGVTVVLPLTILDAEGLARLREAAANPDNFKPEGKTAIGSALEAGSEILAQSGTIFRSLIVVTDGESNTGPEPSEVIDAIYANRNSASRPDLPVSTSTQLLSFVGFDTNSATFGAFQTRGARVTSAADQASLEASLQSLLEADITKLESPSLK